MSDTMTIHLRVWRQAGPKAKGKFVDYTVREANSHMSFLELLDVPYEILEPDNLNSALERLIALMDKRSIPGALLVRAGVIK